jgi:hypothetical protein
MKYRQKFDLKTENKNTAGGYMQETSTVKFQKDKTDILVIAPHGVMGDDDRTDIIASTMAEKLGCSSLINNTIKREQCDYNKINEAEKDADFISNIRSVLDADGFTLVVWIHGIKDENIEIEKEKLGLKFQDKLDCLIGFGQPKRYTAYPETAHMLQDYLYEHGISARFACENSKYSAWTRNNMCQWSKGQDGYRTFSKVQSVQLEFRDQGLRSSDKEAERTGKALADAFKKMLHFQESGKKFISKANKLDPDVEIVLERRPDEKLVTEAFEYLKNTFRQHFHSAMLEVGRYLIEKFYNNDYDLARMGKKIKKRSLHQLIRKLQEMPGDTPSKSWIYNAVNLAVDEHDFENFHTYGNLGHSQKVLLTHIKDDEEKQFLIEEAVKKKYTVAQLQKRMKQLDNDIIPLEKEIPIPMLYTVETGKLKFMKSHLKNQEEKIKKKLSICQGNIENIDKVLEGLGN